MRFGFAVALITLVALPAAARAEDGATLAPQIAQCINDNAPKVEAAVSDLNQAVDFLVFEGTRICKADTYFDLRTLERQSGLAEGELVLGP